jgi:hypothetical protein
LVPQKDAPEDNPLAEKPKTRVKPARPRKSSMSEKNTSKPKLEPADMTALNTE